MLPALIRIYQAGMYPVLRRCLVCFMVLMLLFFSCLQAEDFIPGKHYQILKNSVVTRDPTKVEVVEVFWFGCNHCYFLESYIQTWKNVLPKDVDFWKSHATWNNTLKTHARLFYSAKALGIKEQTIPAAFNAIHQEKRYLTGTSELEYFFKSLGFFFQNATAPKGKVATFLSELN